MKNQKKETQAVHSGTQFDENSMGTNTPIYASTSVGYLDAPHIVYPRYFNTINQQSVVEKIAALENGEDGLVFSSGMAAISSTLFSLVQKNGHVVFQKGLYGGTFSMVTNHLDQFGISYTIVENNHPKSFKKAITPETRVIYIETPSNPLLQVTDIEAIAQLAKKENILTIIDNTFASPINQNPIDFGIDIVLHSATKYLSGHSDICAGAVVSTKEIISTIRPMALHLGGSLNAQMCSLLERSLKTLSVRVNQQNKNAGFIADILNNHPKIEHVYYPGLATHNGHDIAKKQMLGFGGMLSFELVDNDSYAFQKKLKLIRPSVSLGGVETTICAPALTSHRHLNEEQLEKEGISKGLLRLSVGIENWEDLVDDIEQAFK